MIKNIGRNKSLKLGLYVLAVIIIVLVILTIYTSPTANKQASLISWFNSFIKPETTVYEKVVGGSFAQMDCGEETYEQRYKRCCERAGSGGTYSEDPETGSIGCAWSGSADSVADRVKFFHACVDQVPMCKGGGGNKIDQASGGQS
jgi:hypothetical protein